MGCLSFQVHTEEIQQQATTNLLKLICDTYMVRGKVIEGNGKVIV